MAMRGLKAGGTAAASATTMSAGLFQSSPSLAGLQKGASGMGSKQDEDSEFQAALELLLEDGSRQEEQPGCSGMILAEKNWDDEGWTSLLNADGEEPAKKTLVPQFVQVRDHSGSSRTSSSNVGGGPPSLSSLKQRIRWTPELHECFVQAVAMLGGPEIATPKAVLSVMSVPDITIYHVKSHLQKYRLNKQIAQIPEAIKAEKKKLNSSVHVTVNRLAETTALTENLRLQMEVQKQLHETIEIQRQLQIQIEARLQQMHTTEVKRKSETLLSETEEESQKQQKQQKQPSQATTSTTSGITTTTTSEAKRIKLSHTTTNQLEDEAEQSSRDRSPDPS